MIHKTLKVCIAGGRLFDDYNLLKTSCDTFLNEKIQEGYTIVIISGCANGADSLGEQYALEKGFICERYPADWENLGRKAGPIRNIEMANVSNALIAFWDGVSKGTSHMIRICKEKGLLVKVIKYDP